MEDIIYPLYHMLKRDVSGDQIADWMAINGLRHSNQMLRKTIKKAGREDLLVYLIEQEDIKIGDLIKSRMTARIGTVRGISADGDTIEVKWDSGGRQKLSKESVYKLRNKDIGSYKDFKKVTTGTDDPYADMNEK